MFGGRVKYRDGIWDWGAGFSRAFECQGDRGCDSENSEQLSRDGGSERGVKLRRYDGCP
jgi:hypothetical protein